MLYLFIHRTLAPMESTLFCTTNDDTIFYTKAKVNVSHMSVHDGLGGFDEFYPTFHRVLFEMGWDLEQIKATHPFIKNVFPISGLGTLN